MSYISRTGNLAATPTLRQGENGSYCYARVIVSDRFRRDGGTWRDEPAIAYDVAVSSGQAENLVEVAQRCGNIRVTFAGRYRVNRFEGEQGTRIIHEVRADELGVSLRNQAITVEGGQRPGDA